MRHLTYFAFLGFFAAGMAFIIPQATSQPADPLPQMPAPIENLVNEGAQVRYLGKDHGLDAWLTIKNGVEQYFYVLPDRSAFIMGVMFDQNGKLVTVQQVQRLRSQGDTLLDTLTELPTPEATPAEKPFEFKTPAEQMFSDIENANWVALGKPGAPIMYSFIDPQCPHCHSFIQDLQTGGFFENGQIQLRIIPVGFREETRAQAAYLIATPNPEKTWFEHMAGNETALPAKSEINQQGVQRNLAIMQSWKFDVTPMIIYRGQDGSVKLVRGKPQNLPSVISDLATAG